jgi:hypothetical protein
MGADMDRTPITLLQFAAAQTWGDAMSARAAAYRVGDWPRHYAADNQAGIARDALVAACNGDHAAARRVLHAVLGVGQGD